MKYVWATLSGLCVAFAIVGFCSDVIAKSVNDETVLAVIFLLILAAVFFILYRKFKNRSIINETKEKVDKVVDYVQDEIDRDNRMSPALLERKRRFQLIALVLVGISICIIIRFYESIFAVIVGTFILIAGITVWIFSDSKKYNESVPNSGMITFDSATSIEQIFDKFKMIDTPLGKPWIGKLKTLKNKAMIFGPDKEGNFVYFWLNDEGITGYVGYSFLEMLIEQDKEDENNPDDEAKDNAKDNAKDDAGKDLNADKDLYAGNASDSSAKEDAKVKDSSTSFDESHFVEWLSESITNYSDNQEVLPYK